MVRLRRAVCLVALLLALPALDGARARAGATTREELATGVGDGAASRLSMVFKVTFLKIEVAEVEALLAPADAETVARLAQSTDRGDDTEARVGEALLRAAPCLISVRFLRGAPWSRFVGGTRRNLDGAAKAGLITPAERDSLFHRFQADFAPIEARGMKKGESICYRIEGDRVRTVYLDAAGKPVVEVEHQGDAHVRGTRGAYFGPRSDFRKGLIRSVVP